MDVGLRSEGKGLACVVQNGVSILVLMDVGLRLACILRLSPLSFRFQSLF